ncbi:hypothetical protein P4637_12180 [Halalkalibacterium halodurans]|uniref:hypothetical protein n=1 Tax=Halalkalibacterium halodurans TaxID=86665 RepID=UPI002E1A13CD|nr:hypothetical protein [Halalkalibacterium halodurans]MED4085571.1 hypothetical protein [Halalkalibacterium halodurans]MED4105582.1 hypothetical protein [Halalkalibacterium halodurans]MED4110361.1 hypothetical protein [Halalkalibacterium halodurans]MED4150979.1 hypothetical protein [Halalkalibacterium halodurans]
MKRIKEKKGEQKKAVQKQFRMKMELAKKGAAPEKTPTTSILEQLQTERKKRKQLSKQLLYMEKKVKQSKTELLKKESQVRKLKKQVSQANQKLKQAKVVEKTAREIASSTAEVNRALERELVDLRNKEVQARKQVSLINNRLMRVSALQQENNTLKKQVKQLLAKQQPTEEQVYRQIRQRKEEVRNLQRRIRQLKQKKEPNVFEMYQQLHKGLTIETVSNYMPNERNVFAMLVEDIEALAKQRQKKKRGQPLQKKNQMTSYLFGTMYKQPQTEDFLFRDLEGKVYQIEHKGEIVDDGLPVKAKLVWENKVEITKVYQTIPKQMKRREQKARKQKVQDKPIFVPIGTFRVCLIGSQRMQRYKKRLEHHGVRVTICNPFEDSPEIIRNACKKSALTIVCTQHTSHTALALAQSNSQHLECIKHDNEENLVARTRFFAKWSLLQLEKNKKRGVLYKKENKKTKMTCGENVFQILA